MKLRRLLSTTTRVMGKERALVYAQNGPPDEVVRCHSFELEPPHPSEARVRFRLSTLNPADINVIEGKYPVSPPKREALGGLTIIGNEGLGIVEQLGESSSSVLKEGDWVVCGKSQLGTWTSAANIDAKELIPLRRRAGSKLTEAQAAMLSVNPATAYRMLKDYVELQKGDWICQNGANSAAGTSVIQLCKAWGIKSINVVRDREDIDSLRQSLQNLGATHVITDTELSDKQIKGKVKEWTAGAPIRLGLNCVSGPSTTDLVSRLLSDDATLVTYGAMSKQPLSLPSSLFIFKNISARGFWLSKFYATQSQEKRAEMASELVELYESGQLREADHEVVELRGSDEQITETARDAIRQVGQGRLGKKLLFRFEQ